MRHLLAGFVALLLCSGTVRAQSCPEHVIGGQPPALLNQRLAVAARTLCFRAFTVLHSGATRTPLYSAEHLTREAVDAAHGLQRVNLFHPEDRLPVSERAELADYARSGYDRGHMSPSGDMPDPDSQAESFSLANMVPQAHALNTGLWERLESAVRAYAQREGELYIVTGPLFQGAEIQALHGRVAVPTHVWKAIYDPRRNGAAAYLAPNLDNAGYEVISIAWLRELSGIDVFPAVAETVKAEAMSLPEPRGRRGRSGDRGRRGERDIFQE